jgi:hypothetical protein
MLMPPVPILIPGDSCTPGGSFGMFGTCIWAENSHFPTLIMSAACAGPVANSAGNTALTVSPSDVPRAVVILSTRIRS